MVGLDSNKEETHKFGQAGGMFRDYSFSMMENPSFVGQSEKNYSALLRLLLRTEGGFGALVFFLLSLEPFSAALSK